MGRDVSGCLMKRSPGKQKKCHFEVGKKEARLGCLQSRLYSYYCHLGYRVSELQLNKIGGFQKVRYSNFEHI